MIHRRYIELDGVRVSYLESGAAQSGAASLVLLHGLMGSADTMLLLMAEFGDDLHVLALDFPGSGKSERRRDIDATLSATSATVLRFLDALDLNDVCLIGHSHGGAVAMHLAAANPNRVRSLTLLAPAHPYFDEGDPLVRFYLSLPGRLFAYSMPWYPKRMQLIGLRRMAGPNSDDTLDKLKPYRENLRTPGTMRHILTLLTTWHADFAVLRKLLRSPLATPALLIWGECDRAVPPRSVVELRAHIAYSELQILEGVGHRPAEETPASVAALISEWLHRPLSQVLGYKPNSSEHQERIAPLITSSFGVGEPSMPAKKWSAPSTHTTRFGA